MNPTRFDMISRLFASKRTRRSAIAGGIGLAAASVGGRALAQEGTPEVATPAVDPTDPHPSADDAQADPEFLFVQPFDAGTWSPKAGEEGTYTLTLTGAAAQTVYFSDRPERIVGLSPTQDFLDGLGFTPENPPNAAVVAPTETGEQGVLVIELLNPAWDGNGTLTYDARVLADYGGTGLAHLARQQTDYEHPEMFGDGGLFIDGCPDDHGRCYQIVNGEPQVVGDITIGRCYSGGIPICSRCNKDGKSAYYSARCADKYPDQCSGFNDPQTGAHLWDCFVDHKCDDIDVEPCR